MRKLQAAVLLALYSYTLLVFATSPIAADSNYSVITGRVVDAVSGFPIVNASILVLKERDVYDMYYSARGIYYGSGSLSKFSTSTDEKGAFRLEVTPEEGNSYWVFAFYDSTSTPGMDYVPGFVEFYVEENQNGETYKVSFNLFPGASLRFNIDDVFFIEDPNPIWREFDFHVYTQDELWQYNCLLTYGSLYGQDIGLGLDQGHVVVPAGHPVTVNLTATAYGETTAFRSFSIDDEGRPFNLTQGESRRIDLKKKSLEYNLNHARYLLKVCFFGLDEMKKDGFYVAEERKSLTEADYLLSSSEARLLNGSFQESFADMREAYLIINNIYDRIDLIYVETGKTAVVLVPFLAVLSLVFSHFLFERRRLKIFSFIAVFIILLYLMNIFFPGFKNAVIFVGLIKVEGVYVIVFEALLSTTICLFIPSLFKEGRGDRARLSLMGAISTAFSIGKRDLRRRRFKTILSLFSLLVLLWSFVALTSVSEGHGLIVRDLNRKSPSQGIMIRRRGLGSSPFLPLEDSVINWLSQNRKIKLIAPKTENVPSLSPLLKIFSQNGNASVRGVIGVDPSVEPQVTLINKIVEDGSGTFLRDDKSVLISESMAETLGVEIGDSVRILNLEFRVDGIFDRDLLSEIVDLDGNPVLPKKLELISTGQGPPVRMWYYCDPNEVIILTVNASLEIPSIVLARIDVLPVKMSSIAYLSRLIVLDLGVDVWASMLEKITYYGIGKYVKVKGFSLVFPFLLILGDIFSSMLNSVYERKKEVSILSTVGLNPTHVALIFIAEGIIIGFIAGGFGYISGLGSYRLFTLLSLQIEVVQKVSVDWGFVAVTFSIIAAIIGTAIPAMKASILTTPSLARKWRLSEAIEKAGTYWKISLPIYIRERDVKGFTRYLHRELKDLEGYTIQTIQRLSYIEMKKEDYTIRKIHFTFYGHPGEKTMKSLIAECEIQVVPSKKPGLWTAYLLYYGSLMEHRKQKYKGDAHAVASFIRRIILRWSDFHFREQSIIWSRIRTGMKVK